MCCGERLCIGPCRSPCPFRCIPQQEQKEARRHIFSPFMACRRGTFPVPKLPLTWEPAAVSQRQNYPFLAVGKREMERGKTLLLSQVQRRLVKGDVTEGYKRWRQAKDETILMGCPGCVQQRPLGWGFGWHWGWGWTPEWQGWRCTQGLLVGENMSGKNHPPAS